MQSSELEIDKTFKIIILGDSQVGKTCILKRYVHDAFTTSTRTTIGADFDSKVLKIDEKVVNLNIWDTAGQEVYRAITNQYYRQASGVFIVFDVTAKRSFENVKGWLKDIKKNCDDQDIIKILIGNKVDLAREVTTEEAGSFALRNKMGYIETSAQENINIEMAFEEITKILLQKFVDVIPKHSENNGMSGETRAVSTPMPKSVPKKKTSCCSGRDYSQ